MSEPAPFRLRAYDRNFNFRFPVSDFTSISVTPRWQAQGSATLVLSLSHHRVSQLLEPGAQLSIDYLIRSEAPYDEASWLRLMTGPCWEAEINGPYSQGQLSLTVRDDIMLLSELLAWPVPSSPLSDQSASEFDVRTGNAETVIKGYLTAAAFQSLRPITIGPNLDRGATVTGKLRMDTLADGFAPLLQVGGLGMTMTQNEDGYLFDVYTPADKRSRVLSESAGTIVDWSFSRTGGPTATRTVIGDSGQGIDRGFTTASDATGLEAVWGRRVNVFTDGKDAEDEDDPTLQQQGAASLLAGRPSAGFSVTMAETDVVRYGRTHVVGDLVKIQITDEVVVENILTECTIAWDDKVGISVAPQIGSGGSNRPNTLLARAINRIAVQQRKQRSGR